MKIAHRSAGAERLAPAAAGGPFGFAEETGWPSSGRAVRAVDDLKEFELGLRKGGKRGVRHAEEVRAGRMKGLSMYEAEAELSNASSRSGHEADQHVAMTSAIQSRSIPLMDAVHIDARPFPRR